MWFLIKKEGCPSFFIIDLIMRKIARVIPAQVFTYFGVNLAYWRTFIPINISYFRRFSPFFAVFLVFPQLSDFIVGKRAESSSQPLIVLYDRDYYTYSQFYRQHYCVLIPLICCHFVVNSLFCCQGNKPFSKNAQL